MHKKQSKKVESTRPVVEEKRKEKKKRVEKEEEKDISSNEDEEEMEYEDAFDDEQESEEEVIVNEEEGEGEGEGEANLGMDDDEMEGEERKEEEKKVFRPGIDKLEEGQELVYDSSAYYMYHALRPSWPCLSFDIFRDSLGENRTQFPHTVYLVAGTQAEDRKRNSIICMKMTDLHKTRYDEDSENESESDEGVDDDPILVVKEIPHHGSVNRLRCVPQSSQIVATWSETGKVHIWNIQNEMSYLDTPRSIEKNQPIFTFSGHTTEGFALDWSPSMEGRLLSGDCNRNIHLWEPFQSTNNRPEWTVANQSFIGHKNSVEDIQWSPIEGNVFASCSVDKTIKIWDTRKKESFALSVVAHDSDVNVISWNRATNFLLASGSDDGSLRIWDLRNFSSKNVDPAADFKWHTKSITSVQWHPTDGSMLAASGADDQISIWDLSLEREDDVPDVEGVPPQLLFVHQGQTDIKEVQWHKQIPGALVSTAATGFNVFKPENT